MRWFAAVLVVMLLFALDRAVLDGQTAEMLVVLLHRGAAILSRWADDLLRFARR